MTAQPSRSEDYCRPLSDGRPRRLQAAPAMAGVSNQSELGQLHAQVTALRDKLEAERSAVANLRVALTSNRDIGAAIGLVMCEYRPDNNAAYAVLVQLSQHENRKLHLLAAELVSAHCAGLVRTGPARRDLARQTAPNEGEVVIDTTDSPNPA